MFNTAKFIKACTRYKNNFQSHWEKNKKTWQAVKYFQNHWDLDTSDLPAMLDNIINHMWWIFSTNKAYNRQVLVEMAKMDKDQTRSLFTDLFDEKQDLIKRIEEFDRKYNVLKSRLDPKWHHEWQYSSTISALLALRYPNKYFFYKYENCKAVHSFFNLTTSLPVKKSRGIDDGFKCYMEIKRHLGNQTEMINLVKNSLDSDCYLDPELNVLTSDFIDFIAQQIREDTKEEWFPNLEQYNPNLTKTDWLDLLKDPGVFTKQSLEVVKRIFDYGGQATCKQLSLKYGKDPFFYNRESWQLAQRVAKKTACPIIEENNENSKWWPILYFGKYADKKSEGNYIWKLRPELQEALQEIDLSEVQLYAKDSQPKRFWWMNANPKIWSFSQINIGEEISYTLVNENGNKRRIYQNFLDAQAGDIVIGYESQPHKQIVAIAEISRSNDGEKLYFKKLETLTNPIDYADFKDADELSNMEFLVNPNGSLFKVSEDEFNFLMDLIREENPKLTVQKNDTYDKESFLNEVYIPEEQYDTLVALLRRKKNLILQGAPGVGKTFIAKRLAYSMMGEKDDNRIAFVQFHQNYSYEDFIMGYKPDEKGFKLQNGIFYKFCLAASNDPNREYFFIIDEINRGNLSKIFGELLMLLESEYRGSKGKAILAYNQQPFSIPNKLYIIGMMNTADRSLAMIDYALRRRFSFSDIRPGFDSEGFKRYQSSLNNGNFDNVIEVVKQLNNEIAADDSLGDGYCIGHSYFCDQTDCTDAWLKQIINYEIVPMLQEYWFDDKDKWKHWEKQLNDAIK